MSMQPFGALTGLELRELREHDWEALRTIRLHALRTEPGVYCSTLADEIDNSEAKWRAQARGDDAHQLFGLFDGARFVGITGVHRDRDDSSGQTAAFGTTYVLPEYR